MLWRLRGLALAIGSTEHLTPFTNSFTPRREIPNQPKYHLLVLQVRRGLKLSMALDFAFLAIAFIGSCLVHEIPQRALSNFVSKP